MGAHGHSLTGACSGEQGHRDISITLTTKTCPQSPQLAPRTLLKVEVPIVRCTVPGCCCLLAPRRAECSRGRKKKSYSKLIPSTAEPPRDLAPDSATFGGDFTLHFCF